MRLDRVDIIGVTFDNVTMEQAVSRAMELVESGKTAFIVTPNAEIAYDCIKNETFCELINRADLTIPDGAGIVLASKILKTPLKQKVAGVELAEALLPELAKRGKKLFLFGAKPGVAERAAEAMKKIAPELNICGCMHGYFENDNEVVEKINSSEADIVFVCLGSPKQEQWMYRNSDKLIPCTMMGLGGSLDVFAGEARRAPDLMIRMNLEWLYRLYKQPSRVGRMMRLPKYLLAAVCKSLKRAHK
jgi:N-acetylglucosaminyldiphosphoundecaprenol N-acetyl-beta-D-mannosaminyltransferase